MASKGLIRRLGFLIALSLVAPVIYLSGSAVAVQPTALPVESLPPNTTAQSWLTDPGGFVVAMAWAPDGRLFYTLKGGFSGVQNAQVRIVDNGNLRSTPFLTTQVDTTGERGLLGIALDPNFGTNHYVYVFRTAPAGEADPSRPVNQVVRYTEDPASQTAILDSRLVLYSIVIPSYNDTGDPSHYGSAIHFGSDGKLYITSGDYQLPSNGQDLDVPQGKILRINPDGSIPTDNPFVNNNQVSVKAIWAYGVRNPFDFAFDPVGGKMFFTENGPSCNDEINIGQAGGNYGWPNQGADNCGNPAGPNPIAPIYNFPAAMGISGVDFYTGPISQWNNDLFFATFDGIGGNVWPIFHAKINSSRNGIDSVTTINSGPAAQVALKRSPDGALYVSDAESPSVISRIFSNASLPNRLRLPLVFHDNSGL